MNFEADRCVRVDELRRLLESVQEINLFILVIDPSDFGQSVENIYHLSFLVQDGTCSVRVADNGEPLVSRSDPSAREESGDSVNRKQLIFEFDMATWRRAIDVFAIDHPFIPHRTTTRSDSR
ncbi:Nse4 C-terminal-domain-containing protein [Suillus cothurnatus]|nr:Nse4 C-terminal-domain-containing protein [Suillus cothurnatus]